MTFVESIKTCFSKFAEFKGRASRSEYWWFALFNFLAGLGLAIINHRLASLFYLVTLLPSIAVATRRLHDTNRSGWIQLIVLIPLIGWIILLAFMAQVPKEPNRFSVSANEPLF